MILFSLLGVYANAEKVLLAYTPTKKRAQCEAVLKTVAAIETANAGNAGKARNAGDVEKKRTRKRSAQISDARCLIRKMA